MSLCLFYSLTDLEGHCRREVFLKINLLLGCVNMFLKALSFAKSLLSCKKCSSSKAFIVAKVLLFSILVCRSFSCNAACNMWDILSVAFVNLQCNFALVNAILARRQIFKQKHVRTCFKLNCFQQKNLPALKQNQFSRFKYNHLDNVVL